MATDQLVRNEASNDQERVEHGLGRGDRPVSGRGRQLDEAHFGDGTAKIDELCRDHEDAVLILEHPLAVEDPLVAGTHDPPIAVSVVGVQVQEFHSASVRPGHDSYPLSPAIVFVPPQATSSIYS